MPAYTDTTEVLYALVPEHHRVRDAEQPAPLDEPLKRYLSAPGDQLDVIALLIDRLGRLYEDTWESDLADPAEAEASWLPWLAQLVGLDAATTSVPVLRVAIGSGFERGTWESLWDALTARLGDDWLLAPHSSGNPFLIGLVVAAASPSETWWDDLLAELAALMPAGHDLEVTASDSWTWAHVAATYDSWADLIADNTDWTDLMDGP